MTDPPSPPLLDQLADVVLVYPVEGGVSGPLVAFNRAAVEAYGYTADELLRLRVTDLLDASSGPAGRALDDLAAASSVQFDAVHLAKDGRRLPMHVRAQRITHGGRLCVLAVCRDDAERRQFHRELSRSNLRLERHVADRTAELEAFAEDLKLLHAITTAEHPSLDARVRAYLEAGCAMYGMPIGILSHVQPDPETGEPSYTVAHVVAPGGAIAPGTVVPLRDAFCDAVVAAEKTVSYADVAEVEALSCHAAYAERGLRSFIGTPIWVGDDLLGTINFVSPEPRHAPFASYECELIEVLADIVGTLVRQDRTERARAAADALHRQVLHAASDGIYGLDSAGRTLFVNPAAVEMTGWPEAEQLGVHQHGLLHYAHADGSAYALEECPISATLRDGHPRTCTTDVFWRPDGSALPVSYTVTSIHDAEGACVRGAVVVFRRREDG